MKKIFLIASLVLGILGFSGCGSTTSSDKKTTNIEFLDNRGLRVTGFDSAKKSRTLKSDVDIEDNTFLLGQTIAENDENIYNAIMKEFPFGAIVQGDFKTDAKALKFIEDLGTSSKYFFYEKGLTQVIENFSTFDEVVLKYNSKIVYMLLEPSTSVKIVGNHHIIFTYFDEEDFSSTKTLKLPLRLKLENGARLEGPSEGPAYN